MRVAVSVLVLSLQLAAAFNVACVPRAAPAQRWRLALMSEADNSAEADLESIRAARVETPAAEPAADAASDEEASASPLPEGYLERSFSSASIGAGCAAASQTQEPLRWPCYMSGNATALAFAMPV